MLLMGVELNGKTFKNINQKASTQVIYAKASQTKWQNLNVIAMLNGKTKIYLIFT